MSDLYQSSRYNQDLVTHRPQPFRSGSDIPDRSYYPRGDSRRVASYQPRQRPPSPPRPSMSGGHTSRGIAFGRRSYHRRAHPDRSASDDRVVRKISYFSVPRCFVNPNIDTRGRPCATEFWLEEPREAMDHTYDDRFDLMPNTLVVDDKGFILCGLGVGSDPNNEHHECYKSISNEDMILDSRTGAPRLRHLAGQFTETYRPSFLAGVTSGNINVCDEDYRHHLEEAKVDLQRHFWWYQYDRARWRYDQYTPTAQAERAREVLGSIVGDLVGKIKVFSQASERRVAETQELTSLLSKITSIEETSRENVESALEDILAKRERQTVSIDDKTLLNLDAVKSDIRNAIDMLGGKLTAKERSIRDKSFQTMMRALSELSRLGCGLPLLDDDHPDSDQARYGVSQLLSEQDTHDGSGDESLSSVYAAAGSDDERRHPRVSFGQQNQFYSAPSSPHSER